MAQEMSTTFYGYPDLPKKVITGDESFVYDYDIDDQAHLSTASLKSPTNHFICQNKLVIQNV